MQETDFYWGRLIYEYICENVACELECRCYQKKEKGKKKDYEYMYVGLYYYSPTKIQEASQATSQTTGN